MFILRATNSTFSARHCRGWRQVNYYLNFMRFEFNNTKMERRLSTQQQAQLKSSPTFDPLFSSVSSSYDVRRAFTPMSSVYIDFIRFGWWPLFPPALKWDFPHPPMGLTLSLKAESYAGGGGGDESSSSSSGAIANGVTDLYTVEAVGIDTCFTPRYYNPRLIRATFSNESLSPNRPAGQYGPLMMWDDGGSSEERAAYSSSSVSFQQPTSEDDISGCYVLSSSFSTAPASITQCIWCRTTASSTCTRMGACGTFTVSIGIGSRLRTLGPRYSRTQGA